MRIDSHQHFWRYSREEHAWITDDMAVLRRDFLPGELSKLLVENAIDGCVAVQASQTWDETQFLLSLARENDFIKGVVGWVDLLSPNLESILERYSDQKILKGFRHIVQSEPRGFLSDNQFQSGIKKLGQLGYTYDLLIYHHQLPEALEFLRGMESVPIVIDHMAKPPIKNGIDSGWLDGITNASTFPNVYCKLSGMVTEATWNNWRKDDFLPYLDKVFDTFGVNRIMYGSDWPVCLLSASYAEQLKVVLDYIDKLSTREQHLVMGDNAKVFYSLN